MDIESLMKRRRSARAYLPTQVKRADIEEIISCAGAAPSAINVQPWEYVVVHGEEKDRLARRLLKIQSEIKVNCGPGTSAPLPDQYTRRSREASAVALHPVILAKVGGDKASSLRPPNSRPPHLRIRALLTF